MSQEWIARWAPVTHAWDAWLLCAVLAVLVPFHGLLAYRRLASAADPIPTRTKLRLYATIMVMEWGLVAVTAVVARRHGLALRDLGQTLGNPRLSLLVTALGLLGLGALTLFNTGQIRKATRAQLVATMRRARKFVPVGGVEIAVFALVSITAGICEEILYRGWLVSFLGAASGSIWIGMVAAAVLFGFGHAYQGRAGVIGTGILGVLFGAMFVLVRSLAPGEVIHAAIDLVNGTLAGRVVKGLGPEASGGDSTSASPEESGPRA
jgi:membrane protease YdiL (CAAX protease family)